MERLIHGGKKWMEVKQIALGARNTIISLAMPRRRMSGRWARTINVEEQDLLGFQLELPQLLVVKYAEIGDSGFLQRQREVHRKFQGCPNIIQCYGDECATEDSGRMIYSVLFEHASGGNLADLV
ncbi:hypothetical protein Scep_012067 [Stephania cephalantha]|uniref:Uncharacterized protein n=1 Tax=Stephania cephalantha TaxID=152367 RepID=A0AAP0JEF7_9MAGN